MRQEPPSQGYDLVRLPGFDHRHPFTDPDIATGFIAELKNTLEFTLYGRRPGGQSITNTHKPKPFISRK